MSKNNKSKVRGVFDTIAEDHRARPNRGVRPNDTIGGFVRLAGCHLAFSSSLLCRGKGRIASQVVTTSEFSPHLKLPPIIWVD